MKKNQTSVYATNKGGKITSPKKQTGEPKATLTRGNDLRNKKSV